MNWYAQCFQKYATFAGRARRKEYWMFTLVNFIVGIVLSLLDGMLGLPNVISGVYSLVVLLPGVSVFVRRMHDTGKSGWWFWLSLVPLVGIIVLLVFLCQDGDRGPNLYGEDPKGGEAAV